MSYVFNQITQTNCADSQPDLKYLQLDDLINSLETYMDRENESVSLAKFLNRNATFLFAPQGNSLTIEKHLKFWEMLFEMLLSADSTVNRIAASTIAHLITSFSATQTPNSLDYDTIAINRLAVELFTELNFKSQPLQTVQFLVERYEFVCEFDSTSVENDEEFEVCFDKGVESIQSSYYYHLVDICEVLAGLLQLSGNNESLMDMFNSNYKLICSRLNAELDRTFLILDRMYFNELTSTKLASHLMFVKKLAGSADSNNQDEMRRVVQCVNERRELFNSFLLMHLDE